ncbi:plasmid partitioning/stability family protein [Sodalis endosymbiont of Spalangia cameroni]|uniref:plasmid partitioning/stability family protein n=1 Tax=Sodalis praecaptivus TaxID=1239307 RepID=UPI0031F8D676
MKNNTFYLYSHDKPDAFAINVIEKISKPLRGNFISIAFISGYALYQIDSRIPALVSEISDSHLTKYRFTGLLAFIIGKYSILSRYTDEPTEKKDHLTYNNIINKRKRFTLKVPDKIYTKDSLILIDKLPRRLRGTILKNMIISGCAMHTIDDRLPDLLAYMPQPPKTCDELINLIHQLSSDIKEGIKNNIHEHNEFIEKKETTSTKKESIVAKNMRKIL